MTQAPLRYVPGVNTMANYEQVLHLIRYKNWHTETLFDRKFKLVCSELNGRYISNDFKVEVRPSTQRSADRSTVVAPYICDLHVSFSLSL